MNTYPVDYPTAGTSRHFLDFPAGSAVELPQVDSKNANDATPGRIHALDKLEFASAVTLPTAPIGEVITISPRAYLKSMWTLFITCFTEPSSETVIDVTTGEKVPQ